MNLLITKTADEDDALVPVNSTPKEKTPIESLIDKINNTNDIVSRFSNSDSCMMRIVGVYLRAYTANMETLIKDDTEEYMYQIRSLYNSLSKFHNIQTESLYKKYEKYLPSDGQFKFLNHIMTDKMTPFDVKSTLSVLYSGLFDTIRAVKDASENTITEAKKNQNTEMIASKAIEVQNGKFYQSKEFAGYSNSEKFYYKIIEKAVANNSTYKRIVDSEFGTHDFNRNLELPNLNYIMREFCDVMQMTISGPIYQFIWDPLWNLTKYLSFFLAMQLKSLYGENIFIDYLAKNKLSIETIRCSDNSKLELISLIVFYAYAVELLEQDYEFFGKKKSELENIMSPLKTIKDLSLEVIQKSFEDKPSDIRKLVNHIYEVFCNNDTIGKVVPEKFRLGNGPFVRFASYLRDDLDCTMSSEAIDKVIERVKEVRNKDVYGEYREDIATFLRNSYSEDAINTIARWITRVDSYNNSGMTDIILGYGRYKNLERLIDLWNDQWKPEEKHITLLGDTSSFGAIMAIAPNGLFSNSNIGVAILNETKAYLLSVLLNAHMNDERSLNWKPDTINLLNMYISYIASAFTYDLYRWGGNDVNTVFSKIFDVFNICGKLKYRTYRIPQFRFKKDEIPPIEHLEPYDIGKAWISKIIATATENVVNKTPETIVEAVVHYLGDGILNNAVNSEYVIMALIQLNDMYGDLSPFTKLTRYILGRVGSQDDEFYKSFENPEKSWDTINVFKPVGEWQDDDESFKTRVARLEKHLEIYTYIAILQRIIINIEFNKAVENEFKDSAVDFGRIETRVGKNWDVAKLGNIYRDVGSCTVRGIDENPIVKDITNAMSIFDSTFVGANTKNNDWFEMNKDRIIVNNKKNLEEIRKKQQDGEPDCCETIGEV